MDEKIIIRKVEPNDAEKIAEIAVRQWTAIYEEYRKRIGEELFNINFVDALKRKYDGVAKGASSGRGFVAEVDGAVAGFAFYFV